MKNLLGLSLILISLLVGCESSEGEWDKLDQADRDYVQNRATEQCLADEAQIFLNFRDESSIFFGSPDYFREKSYTAKLNDSGNNAIEERLIRIWKNTPAYIIFYIEETIGTATDKYFLQVVKNDPDVDYTNDTFGYNDSMIEAIRRAYCGRQIEYSSGDSGPASVSRTNSTTLSSGGRRETRTTHNYNFSEIAYWGFFKRSITIKDYDVEDTVVSTKTYTSTFVENSNPPILTTDYTTLSTKLCYLDPASYALPYTLKCDGAYTADMVP